MTVDTQLVKQTFKSGDILCSVGGGGTTPFVGRTNPPPSPSTSDPPWNRPSTGYARQGPTPHTAGRSSYPDVHDSPRHSVKSDRRYSDAPSRYQQPRDQDRDRDHYMVAARSSPDLNKGQGNHTVTADSASSAVKPAKSSPDIPKDLDKERAGYGRRPSGYEQQLLKSQSAAHSYGSVGYGYGEEARPGEYLRHKSKRVSEDMYTADMNAFTECKPVSSYSLQKYQPDYENVAYLANAPLQSEKISEIMDIDDSLDSEISPPPGSGTKEPYSPTSLPERDPASLKYIKVNQNHEKYPSWPVTQPNTATDQSQPINTRAQSWTDHTNTSKEFPTKQRLAYQPGLRPLQEKNSPTSEQRGDDSSGKAPRNSSDPGFKMPEFTYDRYGRVVQKRKDEMKGRFEDFYQNSKPGYLPPRFDSDGHSYGDKEYNVPSPPERDVAGVDRTVLSQALGTETGEHPSQSFSHHKVPQQLPQPQEPAKLPSQRTVPSSQRLRSPGEGSTQSATATNPAHSPSQLGKRPGALPTSSSQAAKDPRRADMATSPLSSPHGSSTSPRMGSSQGVQSPSHRDYVHRDSAARSSNKPYIVRPTPYYNTSTQTDGQSYAVKMSDPHARLCNVQIQVGEAGSQTSPKVEFEEKSIQARMSREFQPSELDSSSPKKFAAKDKRNFFQYSFEGMQSIQAKYSTDMDTSASSQPSEKFPQFDSGDQASISIMRKLSEEFYGGNKMGLLGEKRHSSASSQEHSPKPVESSGVSAHSGTMSQAESYSSVIIHPSESAGPFGRDDFGSQSSITDSRNDLTSLASSSRSSLKDSNPRGRNSLEYFPRTATRPLQESRKFNSLSSISHQRERSAPSKTRESESRSRGQDMYVDTRSHRSGSHRDSTSGSEPSPSQPKSSPDAGSIQTYSKGQHHSDSSQSSSRSALTTSHHAKTESADSVFSEHSGFERKDRGNLGKDSQTSGYDSGEGQGAKRTGSADVLGRKLSMKKAYGIYDDSDRPLASPKESRSIASGSVDMGSRTRGSYSDTKQLGQIQEEGDSSVNQGSKEARSDLTRHKTEGDISDARQRLDSWRDDLDKRTGRAQRTSSEYTSSVRGYDSSSRPQHLFHASIDSGFGSEISSRADGQMTPSDPSQSSSFSMEKNSGADLKKFQQQAVLNFVQRKTGKSFPSASVEHSPESSLYESIGTPRSPHSPTSETVSDLISKTNETLAKRADSIRRSGSSSSRASSSDYVDMTRQDRSRKETEWSRLRRSSGSFQYGSNRSSLCSENTYEDISVFATPTPRSSTQEMPKDGEGQSRDSQSQFDESLYRGKMDSGVMASPTYQNFPGASRRRAPPPPPRTPSPEPRTPPALPPRNYLQKEDEEGNSTGQEQANVDEAKIDFKSLFNQWENNSPREDAYAAQLRRQAMKFSGQRGSSSAVPSSMSVIHSRTQMGISTSYKRQPTMAQEATSPTGSTTTSVTSSVSFMPAVGNSLSSSQLLSSSDVSQAGSNNSQPSLSPSSQTKESSSLPASADRDSKPLSVTITSSVSRPPHLPERTAASSKEDGQVASRTDNSPPSREAYPSRDRSVSEVSNKGSEQKFVSPPSVTRERSSSDTRVLAKLENSSMSPVGNGVHSPKQNDLPLPSPPKGDNHDGVIDPAELPPPPPELLNDSVGSFEKGEQQGDEPFADDSYGAFRNRGSRQVGNYQRSASAAAAMRPDSQPPTSPTDSQTMFGDHKLGGHNWNSDSQLQPRKRPDAQQGGGTGGSSGVSGSPGTSPDPAGSVPAFKADSGPVRSAVKMFESPQPLAPQSQPQGQPSAGDGKTYTARPYQVPRPLNDCARNERGVSPEQSRSVKERISNLERKSSFSSPCSSSTPTPVTSPMHTANTPTSCSQRWTSATSFPATQQRSGGDNARPQTVNTNSSSTSNRVPNPRSMVLSDSHQPRERPHSGSLASPPTQDPSTQTSVSARPRSYSEHGRQGEMSPPSTTEPKRNQRYTEVPPAASDSRALPGHVRNSSQSSVERPRSSSSPYNRRESAPAPHIPSEAVVAMVSPRRKSEGHVLPTQEELQKEMSPPPGPISASHGRQPSQEELECDQQAKELAKEVAESEKKLSDVLSADASKKRMQYMDGLFSGPKDIEVKTPVSVRRHQSQGSVDASLRQLAQQNSNRSPTSAASSAADHTSKRNSLPKEYFVSPPKAVLEMEWRKKEEVSSDLTKNIHDNEALIRQKEELIEKLLKKLDLLKEERKKLQEEIQEIEELGKRVCESVDCKCENRSERDKFHTYISDLEKIVRLLLNLSGQLARAENAVQALAEDADPEVKKRTLGKRERLQTKHAEAKQLKEDIDKRSDTVSAFLRQSLSGEELNDYAYFVKMKSKLTIELQELEDKITLGQEQIQELKKSIPERIAPPLPESEAATMTSSPASSPVPPS